MLPLAENIKARVRALKKRFMAYAISDRIRHTFGRDAAYFGWKDRATALFILLAVFAAIFLLIVFYPNH